MAVGDGGTGSEGGAWCSSAEVLQNFVMQRAIQTKLYHLNQVRNQPTYEYLQNFLDHAHLQVVRVTDYDFKCLFHGANGLKTDWKVCNADCTREGLQRRSWPIPQHACPRECEWRRATSSIKKTHEDGCWW